MLKIFKKKDKKLGVADYKSRYDIPLNTGESGKFTILMIALMSFLACMALSGTFALDSLTQRWSSGLENSLTIEVPATDPKAKTRSQDEIIKLANTIKKTLINRPELKELRIMSRDEIQDLIKPWLGDTDALDDLPIPGLISVTLKGEIDTDIPAIEKDLQKIASDIAIDTHENWLNEIIKLTGSLKFTALFITLVIMTTTIIAIAGAVRARLAEHKADVELLHLMGASDHYITSQFQKHASTLSLKGSAAGLAAAALIALTLSAFAAPATNSLMPSLELSWLQIGAIILIPAAITALAWLTAKMTVTAVLSDLI